MNGTVCKLKYKSNNNYFLHINKTILPFRCLSFRLFSGLQTFERKSRFQFITYGPKCAPTVIKEYQHKRTMVYVHFACFHTNDEECLAVKFEM